jgi:hypothetical protein
VHVDLENAANNEADPVLGLQRTFAAPRTNNRTAGQIGRSTLAVANEFMFRELHSRALPI